MKTVIFGAVTPRHLADAALFAGIEPSGFITNGAPRSPGGSLPVEVIPIDPMVGDAAVKQNNWRLVLRADALVCVGDNPHLVQAATRLGLLVHVVEA